MTAAVPADGPRARALIARLLATTGAGRPLRAIAERAFGGCVLAFHDLDAGRFITLVEAMAPSIPVPLDELVERLRAGRSVSGLFAITIDDGVGETVRAISAAAIERHWPVTFFLPTDYVATGEGMAFQWLDVLLATVPRTIVPLASGAVDLSTDAARRAFDTHIRRLAYTRPADEYLPLLGELRQYAVTAGWLGGHAPPAPVTPGELAALAAHPELRFESHGVTHTAVCALTPAVLEAELGDSRARIAAWTGRPARHFCYPFGGPESIGSVAPALVARVYASGVTMTRGRVRGRDPALLPRIPLYPRDTPDVVRLKLLAR